jgi:hypothetical protein
MTLNKMTLTKNDVNKKYTKIYDTKMNVVNNNHTKINDTKKHELERRTLIEMALKRMALT